jgi:hypothetical protein
MRSATWLVEVLAKDPIQHFDGLYGVCDWRTGNITGVDGLAAAETRTFFEPGRRRER